jgi:diguanylate cyclase (GGDEF)-like protein
VVRHRGLPILALGGAIVLAALAAASVGAERAREAAVRDRSLVTAVQAERATLENYFQQARTNVLLTAHNPSFSAFYADPRSRSSRLDDRRRTDGINEGLRFLHDVNGSIGEACFIDATSGRAAPENARIVNGQVARTADLSADESGNFFYLQTIALPPGEVYQAETYRSPDTDDEVISNSTPLYVGGRVVGVVHYEVSIDSFRNQAADVAPTGINIDIVNSRDGEVVFDASASHSHVETAEVTVFRRFVNLSAGKVTDSGALRVAVAPVGRSPGNMNRWFVAASMARPSMLSFAGVGPLAVTCVIGAIMLVLVSVLLARRAGQRHERELERVRGERRDAEERSRTDALTGLFNRRGGSESLAAELRRAEREGHVPGVLLVDADRFKRVNDSYGHQAGDLVLLEIGRRLRAAVREYDIVCRWGGEEFCVIVPSVESEETLRHVGDALRRAVSTQPIAAGPELLLPVTVSVGAARGAEALWSVEGLVDAADRALYAAKRRGRDQVRLFTEMTVEDFVAEEPEALRLAQALALSAAVREGMPELHSQQVAELSAAIAQQLGLDEPAVLRTRLGGWLHDVGKVAIPDRVLAKRSALDAEEWATMRTHAEVGEQIIRRVAGLVDAAPAVRNHHERWDGTGYPDGLAGDEIPLEARIVGVADAYSAITSDRPYQAGRSREEAVVELRRSAGTHLDPDVVEALIRVLEEQTRDARSRLGSYPPGVTR